MSSYDFWSVVPPVLAIALAIRTRQVIISLLLGLFAGWTIINGGNPLTGFLDTLNGLVDVFASSGNARTVLFTLYIGALIQLIRHAGGISGFINRISRKFEKAKSISTVNFYHSSS